ncbi:hypothetical protein G7Y79_00127g102020, partial [Physcia stellaris]
MASSYPSPPTTTTKSSSSQSRTKKRRCVHDSASSGSELAIQARLPGSSLVNAIPGGPGTKMDNRELNARILRILSSSPKLATGWRSIDPVRMGYEDDQIEQTSVTISITVDWTLDPPDWSEAEKEIKDALLSAGGLGDVDVEFERDARSHEFYSTKEDYPEHVPTGADLGPRKYFTVDGKPVPGPLGTIGGSAMAGHSYALDKNGNPIELWGPPKLKFTYSTKSQWALDHNFSLLRADVDIARYEELLRQRPGDLRSTGILTEQRASKARKIQYFDDGKQAFGALYLCSGYRERFQKAGRNHRMDIAFIEVKPDKLGDNTIPNASAWPRPDLAPIVCGDSLNGMVSCDGGASLGLVFKVG